MSDNEKVEIPEEDWKNLSFTEGNIQNTRETLQKAIATLDPSEGAFANSKEPFAAAIANLEPKVSQIEIASQDDGLSIPYALRITLENGQSATIDIRQKDGEVGTFYDRFTKGIENWNVSYDDANLEQGSTLASLVVNAVACVAAQGSDISMGDVKEEPDTDSSFTALRAKMYDDLGYKTNYPEEKLEGLKAGSGNGNTLDKTLTHSHLG